MHKILHQLDVKTPAHLVRSLSIQSSSSNELGTKGAFRNRTRALCIGEGDQSQKLEATPELRSPRTQSAIVFQWNKGKPTIARGTLFGCVFWRETPCFGGFQPPPAGKPPEGGVGGGGGGGMTHPLEETPTWGAGPTGHSVPITSLIHAVLVLATPTPANQLTKTSHDSTHSGLSLRIHQMGMSFLTVGLLVSL